MRQWVTCIAALCAPFVLGGTARAQIDPGCRATPSATRAILQANADGGFRQVGEVFTEVDGAGGAVEHWVYFEDYAPEQPILLGDSGAAYPGLMAFLGAARRPGSAYVAVAQSERRCATEPTCVTLTRDERGGGSADALLRQSEPEKRYGASQSLTVSAGSAGLRHALLAFDLSPVPAGAVVLSADLTLTSLLGSGPASVHAAAAPWAEGEVTWGDQVRRGAALGAGPLGPYAATVDGRLPAVPVGSTTTVGVRTLAQGWVDGRLPNFGLRLVPAAAEESVVFASGESPNPALRPRLTVCYERCGETCEGPCGLGEVCAGGVCRAAEYEGVCMGLAPPEETEACSGQGVSLLGRCFCNPGFSGDRCQLVLDGTDGDCGAHGIAAHGRCFCEPGYTGERCETPVAPPGDGECGAHGVAALGRCFCEAGYTGDRCETPLEPGRVAACDGHGIVLHGLCYCQPGYFGEDCSRAL